MNCIITIQEPEEEGILTESTYVDKIYLSNKMDSNGYVILDVQELMREESNGNIIMSCNAAIVGLDEVTPVDYSDDTVEYLLRGCELETVYMGIPEGECELEVLDLTIKSITFKHKGDYLQLAEKQDNLEVIMREFA